ncbi:uncharacterized protein PG986_002679 [Apiospora aurea]|uniref:Uncharacterized protein n=1 Tax=Apiospora aurea TaxID=335848 RepID=A0ABR1QPI2_9PEZI
MPYDVDGPMGHDWVWVNRRKAEVMARYLFKRSIASTLSTNHQLWLWEVVLIRLIASLKSYFRTHGPEAPFPCETESRIVVKSVLADRLHFYVVQGEDEPYPPRLVEALDIMEERGMLQILDTRLFRRASALKLKMDKPDDRNSGKPKPIAASANVNLSSTESGQATKASNTSRKDQLKCLYLRRKKAREVLDATLPKTAYTLLGQDAKKIIRGAVDECLDDDLKNYPYAKKVRAAIETVFGDNLEMFMFGSGVNEKGEAVDDLGEPVDTPTVDELCCWGGFAFRGNGSSTRGGW